MQGFELPDTSWRYRSDTMHNIRLWKHLERNFAPLFLLAPAAAASEPAPGQQAEFLRARKRRHAAALAGPIFTDSSGFIRQGVYIIVPFGAHVDQPLNVKPISS